ncbi:hypothetical protein EIN_227700 [Entamoeba invadens IP1]|uniref:Digestive organ expansion factor n=1 Tax=Entamoeba invadens IP1 TaxID=370355 RepID=A0A0A1U2R4_ENTIV|nr:hypothetical protein EIN_227700 [Entamoeba invadens IP1]ELP88347.1 hypothetical protein EIN_227700 [Entamoeba invadens IP1]|eukprot:XP_004255118.1 hypothetical protein EIN_227700 [Entamoeba invadens IP1]
MKRRGSSGNKKKGAFSFSNPKEKRVKRGILNFDKEPKKGEQGQKQQEEKKEMTETERGRKIMREVEEIQKVGKLDEDDEDKVEEDLTDVFITQETEVDELPKDVTDECMSNIFLNRPIEEAMMKLPMKMVEKNEQIVVQSNFEEITGEIGKRPENVPISLWKEFVKFLKENKLELDEENYKLLLNLRGYADMFVFHRMNGDQFAVMRLVNTLHIATHLREIRCLRLKHTLSCKENEEPQKDLGFVQCSTLVLFPFKTAALIFIKTLLSLMGPIYQKNIRHEDRFVNGFRDMQNEMENRPKDYYHIFEGNNDDKFRVGISFGKDGVHLYTETFKADLIVASPLGIKAFIEKQGTTMNDMFSSIKLIYIESIDVMEMQNMNYLMEILNVCNKLPVTQHETDIRRVYSHEVEEKGLYYRQSIIYGRYQTPLNNSIVRMCQNSKEMMITENTAMGSLSKLVRNVPINFNRYTVTSALNSPDERFEHFTKVFLPWYMEIGTKKNTLIMIPSYFDYLRVKNYFKEENINGVFVSEYISTRAQINAEIAFKKSEVEFMIITERSHFFNRKKIKGIQNIIFYELPNSANFVPELINFVPSSINDFGVFVLFNKLDTIKLRYTVGDMKAAYLMTMEQDKYTFM